MHVSIGLKLPLPFFIVDLETLKDYPFFISVVDLGTLKDYPFFTSVDTDLETLKDWETTGCKATVCEEDFSV